MRFRKSNPAPGSRPGTLAIPEESPPPRIFVFRYSDTTLEEREVTQLEDLPKEFPEGTVTWIDVQGLGDEEHIRAVGARFGLTPLELEDAVNVPQRAKSELHARHHLVISRVPLARTDQDFTVPQVCFIVGKGCLLTFQEVRFGIFDPVRERIRAGIGPIRTSGADYLAYALIDTMVDRYYPIAEGLANGLDDLEQELFDRADADVLPSLRRIRGRLVVLRRIVWPQREMVNALLREQSSFVSPTVQGYLRDTYDHIAQIAELVDSLRDLAAAISDEHLSTIGQRTNEIMKVLTLMASVFIPLTFIAGIYGMNFENMPELRSRGGYFVVLAIMAIVALVMVAYFWRRGWVAWPWSRGGRRRRSSGRPEA